MGLKFRRQHPVGPYIIDFYCAELRLAIELDGGQHFTVEGLAYDRRRTGYLAARGVRVFRFTNSELIENTEGVLETLRGKAVLTWENLSRTDALPRPGYLRGAARRWERGLG
jgi:very-short-patch-repair endonuclease